MTRWIVGMGLVSITGLAMSGLQARQEQDLGNAPGMPTIARTYVLNRGAEEAVPVTVNAGGDVLPVELVGQPRVSLAPDEAVPVRAERQAWEYRRIVVDDEQADEAIETLNEAGEDGWEAVGVVSAADGQWAVLLKRPQ